MKHLYQDAYFDEIITIEKANTPEQVFEALSQEAAKHIDYPASKIHTLLNDNHQRRRGSIGQGVTIPQLKIKGLKAPLTLLAKLKSPVKFEQALDHKHIDIACLTLSPERIGPIHLTRLAKITRILKDEETCAMIRETNDNEALKTLLNNPDGWLIAA